MHNAIGGKITKLYAIGIQQSPHKVVQRRDSAKQTRSLAKEGLGEA